MLPFAELVTMKITKSHLNGASGCELSCLKQFGFSYNEETLKK